MIITALLLLQLLALSIPARAQDPEIVKVQGEWQAEWDFSHPENYTLENTTIENERLELSMYETVVGDDRTEDFRDGSAFQVLVRPPGSIMLSYDRGSGFTEIHQQAGVQHSGNALCSCWGDFDGDGYQDLFVGRRSGQNFLYRNNADGTFDEVAGQAGVSGGGMVSNRACAWGDMDNDGHLDLFSTTMTGILLWRNEGDGTFDEISVQANLTSGGNTEGAAWVDYDRDGWIDLWSPAGSGADNLFQNNGNGTFSDNASQAGVDDDLGNDAYVTVGDYDGDGWDDLLKSMELSGLVLYRNNGDGTFVDRTNAMNLSGHSLRKAGLVMADIDGDGEKDIYHVDFPQDRYWLRKGNEFQDLATQSGMTENEPGRGVSVADFDLDGHLDIFVANWGGNDVLWHNDGDGTFTDTAPAWGVDDGGDGVSATMADMDNDGDPDLFVARDTGSSLLYRNDLDSGNAIRFRLEGNTSNRAALGAEVDLYRKDPGGDVLIGTREVVSGSGYGSCEGLEPVFGANTSDLHRAVVTFPGGGTVTVDDIGAPSYLAVNENGQVTELDMRGHHWTSGNFTSRPIHLGDFVSWGELNWTADVPTGTDMVVKTRTSPDGSSWGQWSDAYTRDEQVKSPKDAYIQYWVQLTTTDPALSPELFNLTISYHNHLTVGRATTEILPISPAARTMKILSFGNNNGQSISFSYSSDGGATWNGVPPDGNISFEVFHNISIRMELETNDETVTPEIQYIRIIFTKNSLPHVALVTPDNGRTVPPDVGLEWEGTDPDGDNLTYDLHLGTTAPYPVIARNLSDPFFEVSGLNTSMTYHWYVRVWDTHGGSNTSMTRSFIVNSLPEIDLLEPVDDDVLDTTTVTFRWEGYDQEQANLTYDLFIDRGGSLTKELDGVNQTNYTVELENLKSYRWYVVVDDGHLTAQSPIWTFEIGAPVNNPPELVSPPPLSATVGTPYNHMLEAQDPDGDTVTFHFTDGMPIPAGMTMTRGGYIDWVPPSSGIFQLGIYLDDGEDQVRHIFNITVRSPTPNQKPTLSPMEDVVLKGEPVTVYLGDHVEDDGPLSEIEWTVTVENEDLAIIELDGHNLTLHPRKGARGKTVVSVTARDGDGATDKAIFNLTVKKRNGGGGEDGTDLTSMLALLLLLIMVVVIIIVLVARKRSRKARKGRPKRTERIETWDEMKDELYEEKRVEDFESSKASFRGDVGGYSEEELLEDMYGEEEVPDHEVYKAPEPVEVGPPETGAAAAKGGPVFGRSMSELEEGEDGDSGRPLKREVPKTQTWKPVRSSEEAEVFRDERTEKAQREEELDDILDKLKDEDGEDGGRGKKKKGSGSSDLEEILSRLDKD